jgi:hypothetical protein
VSRRQNDGPVHWRARVLSGGRAWTACGHVLPEDATTTDCVAVTCEQKACRKEADERFEDRRAAKAVSWGDEAPSTTFQIEDPTKNCGND